MKDKLMISLKPEFKKKLFSKLLREYGIKYLKMQLKKTHGIIYHYKNNRVKFIPLATVKKLVELLKIGKDELEKNIMGIKNLSQIQRKYLDLGRNLRKNKLKKWKRDIPKIKEIIEKDFINLEKWFYSYKKLIDFGTRKFIKVETRNNKIILEYTCFSKGKKKLFKKILPAKIKIDRDFLHFFGLWLGDKAGGGRLGVVNKDEQLLKSTDLFLKRLYQKTESYLYVNNQESPKIIVDRIFETKNKHKGYSISIHANNSILKSFFSYLEENLIDIISLINEKNIIMAGLFDAEGNVSLEDKCFRWGCKNKKLLKKLIPIFKNLNLFDRYDGCNIVSYNKEYFLNNIKPFIKNKKKINRANLIFYKKGYLEERFIKILKIIKENPNTSNKEIAKVLKRVRANSQTKFLKDLGYIKTMDNSNLLGISNKGLKAINAFQEGVIS